MCKLLASCFGSDSPGHPNHDPLQIWPRHGQAARQLHEVKEMSWRSGTRPPINRDSKWLLVCHDQRWSSILGDTFGRTSTNSTSRHRCLRAYVFNHGVPQDADLCIIPPNNSLLIPEAAGSRRIPEGLQPRFATTRSFPNTSSSHSGVKSTKAKKTQRETARIK